MRKALKTVADKKGFVKRVQVKTKSNILGKAFTIQKPFNLNHSKTHRMVEIWFSKSCTDVVQAMVR